MFLNTQQPESPSRRAHPPKRQQLEVNLKADMLLSLKGKHEIRLYELAKACQWNGATPRMSIKEFRDFMGIQPGQYTQFSKLRERVIDEPIKRINENKFTDILISSQFKKKGAEVVAVAFVVESRFTMTLRQHKLWKILLNVYREAYLRNGKPLADGEPCYLPIELLTAFLGREVKIEEIAEDLEALTLHPVVQQGAPEKNIGAVTSWQITPARSIEFRLPTVVRKAVENVDGHV